MGKKLLIIATVVLLNLSFVSATSHVPSVWEVLDGGLQKTADFFSFEFINADNAIGFIRFVMWIILFAVLYSGATKLSFTPRISGTVAAGIATLGTLGTPTRALENMLESFGVASNLLLLGGLIVAAIWVAYGKMNPTTIPHPFALRVSRIIILIFVLFIFYQLSSVSIDIGYAGSGVKDLIT